MTKDILENDGQIPLPGPLDLSGFIDQDILDAFKGTAHFHHDIIGVQLSRDLQNLTKKLQPL